MAVRVADVVSAAAPTLQGGSARGALERGQQLRFVPTASAAPESRVGLDPRAAEGAAARDLQP